MIDPKQEHQRPSSQFREMFKERLETTPATLAEYVERVAALACISAHCAGQLGVLLRAADVDIDDAYDYAANYTHSSFSEETVAQFAPHQEPTDGIR